MTCRRSCDRGQPPYEIADVMKFLIDPPEAGEVKAPDAGAEADEAIEDFHLWAPVPPDRPMAAPRKTGAAYRFAWNG